MLSNAIIAILLCYFLCYFLGTIFNFLRYHFVVCHFFFMIFVIILCCFAEGGIGKQNKVEMNTKRTS
jgi:ABC-type multidrug transport system permease subunit